MRFFYFAFDVQWPEHRTLKNTACCFIKTGYTFADSFPPGQVSTSMPLLVWHLINWHLPGPHMVTLGLNKRKQDVLTSPFFHPKCNVKIPTSPHMLWWHVFHLFSAVLIATKENDIPLPSTDNEVSMATQRSSLLAGVRAGTLPSFPLRTENVHARVHGIWPSALGRKLPER